ncbi:MAG: Fe-S cluster assembly ATPase SufC [Thermofilum sp.]|nr:Fe-S cluster assembly ATPase SufC [Thermofilum sp.]
MIGHDGLYVDSLRVSVNGRLVLRGVTLHVPRGRVVGLVGPNGSGKTSLAYAVLGHPLYRVEGGEIYLDGEPLTGLKTEERARRGVFLAFQSPPEIPGLEVRVFLRGVAARRGLSLEDGELSSYLRLVGLDESYLGRGVHEGFSGGERKRLEFAQALLFKPKVAILDEVDSGLDLEGVRLLVSKTRELAEAGAGVLFISHNPHVLQLLRPDEVVVLVGGEVALRGGLDVLEEVVRRGYPGVRG